MKLSDKQFNFLQDVAMLIQYCASRGIKVTGGELYRTAYQHAEYRRIGYTQASRSKHQERLAIDLNLFRGDTVMWDMQNGDIKKEFGHVGKFWESLRTGNKWGGHFKNFFDPTHFETTS